MELKKDKVRIGKNNYLILAFSEMGLGKLENQDSFQLYFDNSQIIVTLADGLGSAIFSKEGSSKIAKILVNLLKENIDDYSLPLNLFQQWKKAVQGNLNLYDTTIKFIQITDGFIKYGGIGDGWIAINKKDDFISLVASNIFSNQTDSILSFDLRKRFINEATSEEGVLNMMIATDGFSEDIEKDKGKQFMDAVSEEINKDCIEFENEMKESLKHWPVDSNRDDKTVIFIQRMEA